MTKCIVLRHAEYVISDYNLNLSGILASKEKGELIRNTIENFSHECVRIITSTTPRAKQTGQYIAQGMGMSGDDIMTTEHLCEDGYVDRFLEFLNTITLPLVLIIITHQPRLFMVAKVMGNTNECSFRPKFLEGVEFELNIKKTSDLGIIQKDSSSFGKTGKVFIPEEIIGKKRVENDSIPSAKIIRNSDDDLKTYEEYLLKITCLTDVTKIFENYVELWKNGIPSCCLDEKSRKQFLLNKILSHKFNQKLIWIYSFLVENALYMSDDLNKLKLLTYFILCKLIYSEVDESCTNIVISEETMQLIIEWSKNIAEDNQDVDIGWDIQELIDDIINVLLTGETQLGDIDYISKLHFYGNLSNAHYTPKTQKIIDLLTVLIKNSILQDLKEGYIDDGDSSLVYHNLSNDLYESGYLGRDLEGMLDRDTSFNDLDPLIIKQRIRQITIAFLQGTDINFCTPKKHKEYEGLQLLKEGVNPKEVFDNNDYRFYKKNYYSGYINKFSTVISRKSSIELVNFILFLIYGQFGSYLDSLPNSNYFFELFNYGNFLEQEHSLNKYKTEDVLEYLLNFFGNMLMDSCSAKFIYLDNLSELVRNIQGELQLYYSGGTVCIEGKNKKKSSNTIKKEITEDEFQNILKKNLRKKHYPQNRRNFLHKKIYKENSLPSSEDFTLSEPQDLY